MLSKKSTLTAILLITLFVIWADSGFSMNVSDAHNTNEAVAYNLN